MFDSYQDAFDQACLHLAKQKRRAMSQGHCQYLTESGLKCIVGAFIPEGHKGQKCGGGVFALIYKHPDLEEVFSITGHVTDSFWENMQSTHDNSDTLDQLKERLNEVAEEYKLNPSSIDLITEWNK